MSFKSIIEKVVGTYSDRELKRIKPVMEQVLALDEEMRKKPDSQLREMTDIIKER